MQHYKPDGEPRKIIRWRHVRALTSLSRMTVDKLEALGDFPDRFELTPKVAAWYEDEILAWLDSRRNKRWGA